MSSTVSDTTVSPPPFSPFDQGSVTSGDTSDDAPDLGDFTTVFRTFAAYHNPRIYTLERTDSDETTPTSSWVFPPSDYESEAAGGSTVWSHGPIASYLNSSSSAGTPLESSLSSSDTESGELPDNGDVARDVLGSIEPHMDDSGQPSLGLAGALDFLAAERAKFVAQREVGLRGHTSSTSDGTWRHVVQPRRKRRRRRNRSAHHAQGEGSAEEETQDGATASLDDAGDSSFSSDEVAPPNYYESTPPSPPNGSREQRRQHALAEEVRPKIHHSRSTPSLRLPVIMPIDARVLQLRNLAHKLRMLFPKDASALSAILSRDHPDTADFVDPRGPAPRTKDTPVHIFIDHSNILIGFLSYLKRHRNINRKTRYMSHPALALILERGRPVTRRVLATSSPLYQPVDSAEQLGYEVHVLQRVPDDGDGADRQHGSGSSGGEQTRPGSHHDTQHAPKKGTYHKGHSRGHSHKSSIGGGNSTESDTNNNGSPAPGRRRYREQGVDELLQLKVHQAIANVDEVPPGATIVLATGDGNVGQFNEEGFLGCVRLALKKGWRVELYAWEGGLSKMWKREFGANKRFEVHMLDRFGMDLLEL